MPEALQSRRLLRSGIVSSQYPRQKGEADRFNSLLDNALHYAPPGSAVRVALYRAGGAYAISVSDEGPGIPAEVQPRIFERFYRVDAARSHEGVRDGGAGLGLALARWIAEVHGGDVKLAASSRLGSTFVVTLPSSA